MLFRQSQAFLLAFQILFIGGFAPVALADIDPKYYAVEASAQVQLAPPQITLVWPADSNASTYTLSRRSAGTASWTAIGSLPGSATSFPDRNVLLGAPYEYQISKTTGAGYAGFGYVYAGINAPLIESRGTIILLVDSTYAQDLAIELAQLVEDLVGDGWSVLRHDVSRTDSPANIKHIIQSDYFLDPAHVRTVFLFGHIPVAYSGNLNPDAHPNHQGAWPADVFYGDMDGSWTDNTVNNTSAERQANWNVPGDGKFDQSELPSDLELEVGRVDLSNMTCFSNKVPSRSERDLLRQYLNKDHRFRHAQLSIQRRGIVCDNFGDKEGEAFASSGWRNFAAFFGAENVSAVAGWNYFPTVATQSYLWSYGCGGGGYYTCDGVGSSDDFATTDVQTVFSMFLGSYFGDWDNESNFLRAPLGSTSSALAVAWAGRPHCFFQHMALGETIGYGIRLSQNNRDGGMYSPQNYGTYQVHVALMGDPTLRLHPVLPPSGLKSTTSAGNTILSWTPSADTDLVGYHVYRAETASGPFLRVTGSGPITETTFTDSVPISSGTTFLVRAVKLEHSASGTYFNPSQGVFLYPDGTPAGGDSSGGAVPTVPAAPSSLVASAPAPGQVSLSWTEASTSQLGFHIQRKPGGSGAFQVVASVGAEARGFNDSGLAAGALYDYRVAAFNSAGDSAFSNEASATTESAPATPSTVVFVGSDTASQGNWSGLYGEEGYDLIGDEAQIPPYAFIAPTGTSDWTWLSSTSDSRALRKKLSSEGIAACWYSATGFNVEVDLRDGQTHRVTLYCLDWDSIGRNETIEVLDANTAAVLSSQTINNFAGGAYLTWNISGHVVFRISLNAGANAVLSGIFFDTAAAGASTVAAPTITPNGGTFYGPVTVALSSATPDASIRYSLDGSEPGLESAEYHQPFTLTGTVTVKAKAYKTGMIESATTTANFSSTASLGGQAQATFIKADTQSQGNWKGVYGSEGYQVIADNSAPPRYPGYVQVTPQRAVQYSWSDSTTDARALQKVVGSGRVAACWYQNPSFSLDINFTDGQAHRLAMYFMDWDFNDRRETIELVDATSGAVLNSQSLADFSSGTYLVWDVRGHVTARINRLAGNNAVLMGLFFGPTPGQ